MERDSGEGVRVAGMIWMRDASIGIMLTVLLSGRDGGGSIRFLCSSKSGVGWRKESGGMNGGVSNSGLCGETGLWTGKSEVEEETYEAGLEERSERGSRVYIRCNDIRCNDRLL